jgi:hypothetical protein
MSTSRRPASRATEPDHDLVPVAVIAARFGVTVATVKRWRRLRGCPVFRISNVGVYGIWSDVVRWARTMTTPTPTA